MSLSYSSTLQPCTSGFLPGSIPLHMGQLLLTISRLKRFFYRLCTLHDCSPFWIIKKGPCKFSLLVLIKTQIKHFSSVVCDATFTLALLWRPGELRSPPPTVSCRRTKGGDEQWVMSRRLQDKNLLRFVNVFECFNQCKCKFSCCLVAHSCSYSTSAYSIYKCIHLNLGFSLVTTPTSSSLALKSMFRTEDRHDIASWNENDRECEE